jgi:hypothetical protein
MEERTYTQKELYQFVTEYSREAREEGFDAMVGDFVDWIVFRDETKKEHQDNPVLPAKLAIHSSRYMGNSDDVLDTLLETQDAINSIVDYLKEKNSMTDESKGLNYETRGRPRDWNKHKQEITAELARLEEMNWAADDKVAATIFPYVLLEAINILKNSTIVPNPVDYAETGDGAIKMIDELTARKEQ